MRTPEEIAIETIKTTPGHGFPASIHELCTMIIAGIDAWREQDGVEVALWNASHDGVRVVQIDTTENLGRLRINLNEAPIWDGDPETDEPPGRQLKPECGHSDTYVDAAGYVVCNECDKKWEPGA